MRFAHCSFVRTVVTLVVSACMSGTGPVVRGIAGGGNTDGTPPVLAFFVQPNTANVGERISPAIEVVARDSLGNTDPTFTGRITVALASNSTGASLSGTTAVRAVDGIASFGNLAVNKVGTYTLQASAPGAATVTSTAFSITTVTTP